MNRATVVSFFGKRRTYTPEQTAAMAEESERCAELNAAEHGFDDGEDGDNGEPAHTPSARGARDEEIRRYFITDDELATMKPAPELVQGLLMSGEVNMLFAPKNRGKTFLGLHLAYSIATRQSHFLGRRLNRYGTVVYLCAEGRGGLPRRRAAWRQVQGYDDAVPKLVFWRELLDIRSDEHVSTLIDAVRAMFPDVVLIVIDTLSQHMPGGDEGTKDMSAALHGCQRIRDSLNTTVLVMHHPSKADERNERGGSGFRGGCADVLNVEEQDGAFWIKTQNARDRATDGPGIPYVLDVVTLDGYHDDEGRPMTSCVVRHLADERERRKEKLKADEIDQLVLAALAQKPDTAVDLAKAIKKRYSDTRSALQRLEHAGRVKQGDSQRWVLVS